MSHLSELRVLNLAGNHISRVENVAGLERLSELHLQHNRLSELVRNRPHPSASENKKTVFLCFCVCVSVLPSAGNDHRSEPIVHVKVVLLNAASRQTPIF